ncbi:MAG TPA: NACHT domain-containing protein [Chloroflexia bacterium]|jgi:hypothetical protein
MNDNPQNNTQQSTDTAPGTAPPTVDAFALPVAPVGQAEQSRAQFAMLLPGPPAAQAAAGGVANTGTMGNVNTGPGTQFNNAGPLTAGGNIYQGSTVNEQQYGGERYYGPVNQFYGAPDRNTPEEQRYLLQVRRVYGLWTNQHIFGPNSPTISPFITPDTAAVANWRDTTQAASQTRATMGRVLRPGWNRRIEVGRRRLAAFPDALHTWPKVLLVGPPGCGKTAYLQWLALTFAQGLSGADLNLLPVVIDLGLYDGRLPFLEFLRNFLTHPPSPDGSDELLYPTSNWLAANLEAYLEQNRLLLLLDGFNEMPSGSSPAASACRQGLGDFFSQFSDRVWAVVACRELNYRGELEDNGFQRIEIDRWRVEQMVEYVSQVERTNQREEPDGTVQPLSLGDLKKGLTEGNPFLLSIGQLPYLLSLFIALVLESQQETVTQVVRSPVDLLDYFIGDLMSWAREKDKEHGPNFPPEVTTPGLASLAAAMTDMGYNGTTVNLDWAAEHIDLGPLPEPKPRAEEDLIEFSCSATILDKPGREPHDKVRFWHLTYQSYFAARAASRAAAAGAAAAAAAVAGGSGDASPEGALAGAVAPLTPENDELNVLSLALSEDSARRIMQVGDSGHPRGPIVAAQALLLASGGAA